MDPRRRRRRQRRAGAVVAFMVLALGLAFFFESQATTTVILVRHADTTTGMGENPGLSPMGALRAEELSRVLGDADVVQGVDAIIAANTAAAAATAEPLARRLRLPVQSADTADEEALVKRILKEYKGQVVLVISDPDAIPRIIPAFHGSKKVPPMGDTEYDNLYIVSIPWYGKVKTLRLHYGSRPAPGLVPPTPAA
jgi:hypothetical protein